MRQRSHCPSVARPPRLPNRSSPGGHRASAAHRAVLGVMIRPACVEHIIAELTTPNLRASHTRSVAGLNVPLDDVVPFSAISANAWLKACRVRAAGYATASTSMACQHGGAPERDGSGRVVADADCPRTPRP